jgi:hypothetical protein
LLNSSQKPTANIYKWLDQKYPKRSQSLKGMKDDINASTCHANLVYTDSNFKVVNDEVCRRFSISKTTMSFSRDLWRIGNIAISLLELFYGVNKSVGSIKSADDLSERFGVLVDQNKALHAGMASTERPRPLRRRLRRRRGV